MTDRIDIELGVRRTPHVGGITIDDKGEFIDPVAKSTPPLMHRWADAQWKVLWELGKALIAVVVCAILALMVIFFGGMFGL